LLDAEVVHCDITTDNIVLIGDDGPACGNETPAMGHGLGGLLLAAKGRIATLCERRIKVGLL